MKKLAWCTDIHLDFLDREDGESSVRDRFAVPLSQLDCDGVIISGDISLAASITRHLEVLDKTVKKPIYFVLGNHDFYGGSFAAVRQEVQTLCRNSSHLKYLTGSGVAPLSNKTAIVGDDGWYDAYHGTPERSPYVMSDWFQISEYVDAGCMHVGMYGPRPHMGKIIAMSRKFTADALERMRTSLYEAAQSHSTVIVVTHVPPWVQAHRHDGKSGSPMAHPWYTSKMMGDLIEEAARDNPNTKFEVFCGHTHGRIDVQIADKVTCHVGGADYGVPQAQGIILHD